MKREMEAIRLRPHPVKATCQAWVEVRLTPPPSQCSRLVHCKPMPRKKSLGSTAVEMRTLQVHSERTRGGFLKPHARLSAAARKSRAILTVASPVAEAGATYPDADARDGGADLQGNAGGDPGGCGSSGRCRCKEDRPTFEAAAAATVGMKT